jgi:maltooligosyltrehalose trehalohydrolase
METNNNSSRPGINLNVQGEAEVVLWAPFAKEVDLKIKGKRNISLLNDGMGYWRLTTTELASGDQYTFVLDKTKELPDPASLAQPEGVHGPSMVVNLNEFNWTDEHWGGLDLSQYIIYELHTGTFTDEGTFLAIEEKLDYLIDLGITAIEIMPVAQFPGDRNWGYDGVFPFAVQNSYGGAAALQHLVNTCHQKGLAVILDVVYNHLGPEGNYLSEFGSYFTEKYKTPWGNAINFDDAYCDAVRNYFIENALMWFRNFHIDALRMDAVHAIKDLSPKHILQEIKENVDDLSALTNRRYHLIIECDLNDTRFINPLIDNGYGMDAQWTDEFHHALRVTAGQKREGYYSDFNGVTNLAKAYNTAYVYDGQYSAQRFKKFGVKTDNPGQQFIVFSQNHDQVGNRMLGERTSQLVSFEMQKLMLAAVMVSPYLPMLFMGEEFSETNPFLYFVSHTEPELIKMVREGRKAEFKDFHGEGEAPDPQAAATFAQSKVQWDLTDKEPHQTLLKYYKAFIQLRKHEPVFKRLDRKMMKAVADEANNTLVLNRWADEQHIICLMNFSKEKKNIQLQKEVHQWQKLFDSADLIWSGPGASPRLVNAGSPVTLQPESIIIYTQYYA